MREKKKLYTDFHAYWKRFRRYQEQEGQRPAEYIAAAEPQGRGAWHLHLLILFLYKAPYIANAEMERLWGHGYTKTKSLKGVDNPGLYLTAYLGDMEIMEAINARTMNGTIKEVEVRGEEGPHQKKAIIKGARLHMYPAGFNIYRSSRGIKRPAEMKMTECEAQKLIEETHLTYEKTISIIDGSGAVKNIVNYRTYTRGTDTSRTERQETESEGAGS